jgi:hypothetical protein
LATLSTRYSAPPVCRVLSTCNTRIRGRSPACSWPPGDAGAAGDGGSADSVVTGRRCCLPEGSRCSDPSGHPCAGYRS